MINCDFCKEKKEVTLLIWANDKYSPRVESMICEDCRKEIKKLDKPMLIIEEGGK